MRLLWPDMGATWPFQPLGKGWLLRTQDPTRLIFWRPEGPRPLEAEARMARDEECRFRGLSAMLRAEYIYCDGRPWGYELHPPGRHHPDWHHQQTKDLGAGRRSR